MVAASIAASIWIKLWVTLGALWVASWLLCFGGSPLAESVKLFYKHSELVLEGIDHSFRFNSQALWVLNLRSMWYCLYLRSCFNFLLSCSSFLYLRTLRWMFEAERSPSSSDPSPIRKLRIFLSSFKYACRASFVFWICSLYTSLCLIISSMRDVLRDEFRIQRATSTTLELWMALLSSLRGLS